MRTPRTNFLICVFSLCFVLLGWSSGVRAGELPEPPLYRPNPANTALQNLVDWKVQWLRERIKARKSSIAGKKNALKLDPQIDKKTTQGDIDALDRENRREEDEITGLTAKDAFDPKIAGNNQNVKVLRDNVNAAIARFQALATDEGRDAQNTDKSKAERDAAEKLSKEHSISGGKLGGDLDKANGGDLKDFPKG
jgi:hypothetical protein